MAFLQQERSKSCDAHATQAYITLKGAHALQGTAAMPRKQRFKPSRKPKTDQATVSNPQSDDRKEIRPEGREDDRRKPDRGSTSQDRTRSV